MESVLGHWSNNRLVFNLSYRYIYPLEMIFGPQYHYFQTLQSLLILLAGYYAFVKLGFKPMVAATGSLLFFMTPWVTYFYFYFLLGHSFIANILLFLFVYQWVKTEDYKYLFYIFVVTVFSMFGTKSEFWFLLHLCLHLSLSLQSYSFIQADFIILSSCFFC